MNAYVRALQKLVQSRSQDATLDWDVVYDQTLPKVYNFFRYRLADSALAEDLTATTFERAWKARHRFQPHRAEPGTWLLGIARNVWREHLREQRSRPPLSLETMEHLPADNDPEHLLQAQDERERLQTLLARLPEREQELIALKYGAGISNRQIAAMTGLSESNVGTILHRTVRKLRRLWEDESYE